MKGAVFFVLAVAWLLVTRRDRNPFLDDLDDQR